MASACVRDRGLAWPLTWELRMASQPGPAVRQPMPPSPRRGGSKRRTRVLLVVAGAVILVLAAVPILLIQMGPDLIAGDGPLRAELAALQLPPGTTVTRELAEGNRLCLDECPVLTRWYSTTLPAGQAEQALAAALAARGFEQRGRTGSTKPGAPEMDACTSGT